MSRPAWPSQRTPTVAPPSGYTALVTSSRLGELSATLPVDEGHNAALRALRDELVAAVYASVEAQP